MSPVDAITNKRLVLASRYQGAQNVFAYGPARQDT